MLMTTLSKALDGVDLRGLRPGSLIDVETKSRHYYIECLGGDAIRISGHPEYCPQPVPAYLQGLIERGMHLKFLLNDYRPVRTSRIVSLRVDQPKALPPNSSHSLN